MHMLGWWVFICMRRRQISEKRFTCCSRTFLTFAEPAPFCVTEHVSHLLAYTTSPTMTMQGPPITGNKTPHIEHMEPRNFGKRTISLRNWRPLSWVCCGFGPFCRMARPRKSRQTLLWVNLTAWHAKLRWYWHCILFLPSFVGFQGSKSRQKFFISKDGRYFIKTIPMAEARKLRKVCVYAPY